MRFDEVPAPPWIAELPKDARGFPVPAEAGWDPSTGEPVIAMVASDRKLALAMRRGCAVCGRLMPKGRRVYRAFSQGDAANIRLHEREYSHDIAGPLHKSCILYSAMVCPYLRERTSRLGKASTVGPGVRRGTRAAIMGFEDMGIAVYAAPHNPLADDSLTPHVVFAQLVEDIPYKDGEELADLLAEAVEEDADHIDMEASPLYWTADPRQLADLGSILGEEIARLGRMTSEFDLLLEGLTYRAYIL